MMKFRWFWHKKCRLFQCYGERRLIPILTLCKIFDPIQQTAAIPGMLGNGRSVNEAGRYEYYVRHFMWMPYLVSIDVTLYQNIALMANTKRAAPWDRGLLLFSFCVDFLRDYGSGGLGFDSLLAYERLWMKMKSCRYAAAFLYGISLWNYGEIISGPVISALRCGFLPAFPLISIFPSWCSCGSRNQIRWYQDITILWAIRGEVKHGLFDKRAEEWFPARALRVFDWQERQLKETGTT